MAIRSLAILVALIIACAQGCATNSRELAPAAEQHVPPSDVVPTRAKIAFAVARFDPQLELPKDETGGSTAMAAASGASKCIQGMASGPIFGPLITLACLPFGAAIGAAASAPPSSTPSSSNESRIAKALRLPDQLEGSMSRYAAASQLHDVRSLPSEGPSSPTETPRYKAGPDYVIEVSLHSLTTTPVSAKTSRYAFVLLARGRLVRVADGTIVDQFSSRHVTMAHTFDEWTANDSRLLSRSLDAVLQEMAVAFIDEWILIYRGDAKDKTPTSVPWVGHLHTPDYALKPITPSPGGSGAGGLSKPWFGREPTALDTVTPTLSWEKLPASISSSLFTGNPARARNLVYEVKIFDARRIPIFVGARRVPLAVPRSVVQEHVNLQAPAVEVKEPLSHCTYYFWTVRARFELDGRQRMTEWSYGSADFDMHWDRRSVRPVWISGPH